MTLQIRNSQRWIKNYRGSVLINPLKPTEVLCTGLETQSFAYSPDTTQQQ